MTGALAHAGEYMKARKVRVHWKSDDVGRYCFIASIPGADGYESLCVVTAKKYLVDRDDGIFDGKAASFMKQRVLQRASDADAKVILYVARSDQWLVFDPDLALEHGVEPDDRSQRQRNGEQWLDVPKSWAVTMETFLDRNGTPRTTLPSDAADDPDELKADGSGQQGLDRWS